MMCFSRLACLFLLSGAVAQGVGAQSQQSAVQACAALETTELRAECFDSVLRAAGASSPGKIEPSRTGQYAALTRVIVGAKAAVENRVSYNDLNAIAKELAKEIALAAVDDHSAPSAKPIWHAKRALDAYTDSLDFWRQSIEFFARGSNRTVYSGVVLRHGSIKWLAEKRNLPVLPVDLLRSTEGVETETALNAMWADAIKETDEYLAAVRK